MNDLPNIPDSLELLPIDGIAAGDPEIEPRKTPAGAAADKELKASIAHHGLLQPIVVTEAAGNGDGRQVVVVAGRRRLKMVRELREEGIWVGGLVPCAIVDNGDHARARARAIAENTQRANLHPADQAAAFAALVAEGDTIPQIAAAFGIAERTVERHVALTRLSPKIISDYREGRVSGTVARKMATAGSEERQEEIYERMTDRARMASEVDWHLDQAVRGDMTSAKDRLAVFVGLEAYREAGGKVQEDLFADDGAFARLEDPDLLRRLAEEKLEAMAGAKAEAMNCPRVIVDMDETWIALADGREEYAKLRKREPTGEEAGRLEALTAEIDAAGDIDKRNALVVQLKELEGSLQVVAARIAEHSYIKAVVDWNGAAFVSKPIVRTEHAAAPAADDGGTEWSAALKWDMGIKRAECVQSDLIDQPEFAAAVGMFAVARLALETVRYNANHAAGIGLTARPEWYGGNGEAAAAEMVRIADWTPVGTVEEQWGAWMELKEEEQRQVFGIAFAALVTPGLHGNSEILDLATLHTEYSEWWTPDEAFFRRLSKEGIRETIRTATPETIEAPEGWWDEATKKAELAAMAAELAKECRIVLPEFDGVRD